MRFNFSLSLVNRQFIGQTAKKLRPYLKQLRSAAKDHQYSRPESSLFLPADGRQLAKVNRLAKRFDSKNPRYVVVIGIGGSNLGAKAVYDALYGQFDDLTPARTPKMIFVDTLQPERLFKLKKFLRPVVKNPDSVVFNLISKSGGTTESIANAEALAELFTKAEDFFKRLVITTDEGSKLWQWAEDHNIAKLAVPPMVGGRYSVFSTVGLFPLSLVGVDLASFRRGAIEMTKGCLLANNNNPAFTAAAMVANHQRRGKRIHDHFFFAPELKTLGEWGRQLIAESLGKEKNLKGQIVRQGITPTVSIGTTDLHSVAQLYLAGPKDKVTTFINVAAEGHDQRLPRRPLFCDLAEGLAGRSLGEVRAAIYQGVIEAYQKKRLPFNEVVLPTLTEYSLGQFMQWQMITVMMIAALWKINAFDQPQVELYKKETRRILK